MPDLPYPYRAPMEVPSPPMTKLDLELEKLCWVWEVAIAFDQEAKWICTHLRLLII